MEKLSNELATKIAIRLEVNEEQREVMAYGAFALIQIFINIFLLIIIGTLLNVAIEAVIISVVSSILRKYSGGVHLTSPWKCTIMGICVCVFASTVIKSLNLKLTFIFIILLVIIWAYFFIKKYAPVDTPTKPIRNQDRRNRMKKGAIKVLKVYGILIAVNLIFYLQFQWYNCLEYSACITFGIAWQVFTLTKPASYIMTKDLT